ncbi:hypothetical protein M758_12G076700 [Ceratodon purpureus]|uniref:Secreted protein n=1 Tax=Ceratodon purpureus TaxID=3225 RepID=A0A8T0G592_CERPU|nr:hypothetical protein KC19_12G073900 [Ceratodon purpureus]KAG0598471.1 hypothetical protein M758_12G076700 [Ceratodon purpureus]
MRNFSITFLAVLCHANGCSLMYRSVGCLAALSSRNLRCRGLRFLRREMYVAAAAGARSYALWHTKI